MVTCIRTGNVPSHKLTSRQSKASKEKGFADVIGRWGWGGRGGRGCGGFRGSY